jgi:hypothetical protein
MKKNRNEPFIYVFVVYKVGFSGYKDTPIKGSWRNA